MEAMSRRTLEQKQLIPSVSSNVSYSNEAFCLEDGRRPTSDVVRTRTDSRDSNPKPALTLAVKRGSSFPCQVHKSAIAKPPGRSKSSRQRFSRADIVQQVARINESSETRECLSFLCVLLLGAAGVGVLLMLIQFRTVSTVSATLAVIGSSVVLVFIFICITTLIRDGTSLHRS